MGALVVQADGMAPGTVRLDKLLAANSLRVVACPCRRRAKKGKSKQQEASRQGSRFHRPSMDEIWTPYLDLAQIWHSITHGFTGAFGTNRAPRHLRGASRRAGRSQAVAVAAAMSSIVLRASLRRCPAASAAKLAPIEATLPISSA